ncbi:MAG TPA: uroporphyrinogen decarboxylase family protein [Candidatus Hydrogenedentes bacterium]|nr:uroporphyrinogen decarboxylase family protein [Candidatus Hydrogenedentota bacterium]
MTLRERILAVYRGETPDAVPYMLDLSHWFYHNRRMPWDLSQAYYEPEYALIDYHKHMGAGFYLPNLGSFIEVRHADDVQASVTKSDDGRAITWTYETPLGTIRRTRTWEEQTYAWGIPEWAIKTEADLRVLGYALSRRTYVPRWERYNAWVDYVGETGVVCALSGYSAVGHLLNYWLGIAGTVYAMADWPDTVHEVVDAINENNLACVDALARSPAEIVILGDNFSSDVQPPSFFETWSKSFYVEAIRRLHNAGKWVAVHIDGRLRGALAMIRDAGADCADAVTPAPMGDLDPEACRDEAGPEFILSGGVPPDVWLPSVERAGFERVVRRWLELRRRSPRLIAAAGDQVPPGAVEDRIAIMRDLVEKHGRY